MNSVRIDFGQQSCLCFEDEVCLFVCLEEIVVLHDRNKLDSRIRI